MIFARQREIEKISEDKERKDKEQGKQDEKAKEEKWGKLDGWTIESETKQLNFILATKLILIIAHKTQSDQKWQKLEGFGIFWGQKIWIIFAKFFAIFLRFRKIKNSELSKNHVKMMLKSKFGNLGKLVLTRKFG